MKKNTSIRQQLIKSFMGVGAMRLFSIPVGFATSIVLARTLGPESFGQYAFIVALLPLLALPVAGGVPQLLTREVARYTQSAQWPLYQGLLRAAHVWVLLVSLIVLIVYALGGPISDWLPAEGKWALLGIVVLLVPLNGLNAVRNGTIKGLGFPAFSEMPMQFVQPLLLLGIVSAFAFSGGLTAATAVWAQVFGGLATFAIATALFFKIKPKAALGKKPEYHSKKWLVALLPFTLIVLVSTFNVQVGIVLLGIMSTDEAVAAMRVGERGAQFVAMSLVLVNTVISPHIVKAYRDGSGNRLQQLSRQSARGAFMLAFPIGVILIVFGKPLIGLAFGEEYADIAYFPLVILVVAQLVNVFFGSVGQLLSMSGHEKDTLIGQIVALFCNIIVCVLLIPQYGAIGAAIGVSISIVVWNILLGVLVFKKLKIRPTAI